VRAGAAEVASRWRWGKSVDVEIVDVETVDINNLDFDRLRCYGIG
jgi:hypothetical protein